MVTVRGGEEVEAGWRKERRADRLADAHLSIVETIDIDIDNATVTIANYRTTYRNFGATIDIITAAVTFANYSRFQKLLAQLSVSLSHLSLLLTIAQHI